mmetsp:Transcript_25612/g.41635  ORF Transcript_25612/g.41635 Transcript_25612/m.41635 type:complete len:365 (-) Transcript_25612:110-1204(-)
MFLLLNVLTSVTLVIGWQYPLRPSFVTPVVRYYERAFTLRASARSGDDGSVIDTSLHETLKLLGVRGIASSNGSQEEGVVVQTTHKSVAGRGAFYVSQESTNTIQQGDVLAYIPKTAILTLSNPTSLYSAGDDDEEASVLLQNLLSLSSASSWPVSFTLYVGMVASKNGIFSKWIDKFMGPEPPSPTNDNDAQNLMNKANVSQQTASEASDFRYNAFVRDWSTAKEWMKENNNHIMSESLFAKLYSILVSRTANLGPYYNNTRGVIPLHDMINHPDVEREHNIELFTVGDLRELVSEDTMQQLIGRVIEDDTEAQLDDRDVLLVARCEILEGDELFLSYRNNRAKPMDEKERAWTTLQYGFLVQ